jgi:hypothetical protein
MLSLYCSIDHGDGCIRLTPCRSAARAPHERFVDVTPISLRRLRPLQRLVGRRFLSAIVSRSGAERRRAAVATFSSESTSFHRDGIVPFTSLPVRYVPSLPRPPNSPTTLHHHRPDSINFPVLVRRKKQVPDDDRPVRMERPTHTGIVGYA